MKINSVEDYINKYQLWEEKLNTIRDFILTRPLEETIKWNMPVYTYNDKNILGLAAFKNHLSLWFYNGALLTDTYRLLKNDAKGTAQALRQIQIKPKDTIHLSQITVYVDEAITNQKEGKVFVFKKKTPLALPEELVNHFNLDEALKNKFNTLTKYKQNEFIEYIISAKRATTKLKRLEKILPLIKTNTGLNDTYR